MLITMGEMLIEAKKKNYAIPAPNVWDEFSIRAAIEAGEECDSPVILDGSYEESKGDKAPQIMYEQMLYAIPMAKAAKVPVAINLDHGKTFKQAMIAIKAGYTSVMIDCSSCPFEENVEKVKQVVDAAHAVGVSVEAELGHVGRGTNYAVDGKANLTRPEEAIKYVEFTGVDCLAVAVGTAHGPYIGTPHIDFERLEEIRNAVDIPLVMHGGSGTGDVNLSKAARSGINKVNLYTDLVTAGMNELRKFDLGNEYDFSKAVKVAFEGYKSKIKFYMDLLGSSNNA
ncbi:class II fructose-bisphosphate aldolase [Paratissierella segnis]|jgi:fructose-bisphosphate aldolase class II|uniref:Class II fructose-bisphosphate aldolase n=1 Tax=Paratissierella segnis TaxID=2763679 RepID=A0A926ERA2_9FIRM|nr:class II fructose-bisphosphate aldolase [Paratissierella segnis]MBC8587060.1 class II fructose-bisphosphate aldolase [Paratissierella segnis]